METKYRLDNFHRNWKTPLLIGKILVVIIIVCASFAIRFQNTRQLVYLYNLQADARQYLNYSYNLAERNTFSAKFPQEQAVPDSLRSPGYPLFIAVAYKIWGKEKFFRKVIELQSVLGAATVFLTYMVGAMFLPYWGAIIACLLVGFSPHHVMIHSFLLTETLFGFVLLLALFCILQAFQRRSFFLFFGAGLLFGYAYLVNQTILLFPPLFLLILFRKNADYKKEDKYFGVIAILLFLIVFSIFPILWSYRNANLPPGSTTGQTRILNTLTHGTYPGFIYKSKKFIYYPYMEDPQQPAYAQSIKNFLPIFVQRFQERPFRYLSWYIIEKPYYLWSWKMLQARDEIYAYPVENSVYHSFKLLSYSKEIMKVLHFIILIFSALGVVILFNKKTRRKMIVIKLIESPIILYAIMGYYTLLYTVFSSWPRYSIPLRPELYITAVWACVVLGNYFQEIKKQR
jgi:4-amino-4-deoxy-L-arabinose transferase-like glycosyltransferase